MKASQIKKLKKRFKKSHTTTQSTPYIKQLMHYREMYDAFPSIKYLINNALENDRLIKRGLLPQPLPPMQLPDDIQDTIFKWVNQQYAPKDPRGDALWDKLSAGLPELDRLLLNFRDYLEDEYGMWSYTNTAFVHALSDYLKGVPVLEVMAGNGYLSKGLHDVRPEETIYTTDSKDWIKENETGKHPVTTVEQLSAIDAVNKYGKQVQYVLMSWAPDKGTSDLELLKHLRANFPDLKLLVIGEKNGATNSKAFWQTAVLSQLADLQAVSAKLKSFDLIDEQIYLVK